LSSSLLFIPDISGFTEFVNRTELTHSQHVVSELLELIIDADRLGLTLSEVEGDAVLFYKEGAVPPLKEVVAQTEEIFQAFHARLREFETRRICDCGACRNAPDLTLKIVAHAGPIEILTVKRFQKPFGRDVILAHRLLKNDVEGHEYLLVTDSLLESLGGEEKSLGQEVDFPEWGRWASGVSEYDEFGAVSYRYLPLTPLLDRIPDPEPVPQASRYENPLVEEVFVDRPLSEVFELISNLDLRLRWNASVDELRYEPDRINRVGTKHHCVIGDDLIEFETVTDDFGGGKIAYGERLLNPSLVQDCSVFYVLESEGEGTRVRTEVHYQPRPFPASLLAPFFRFGFGRRVPGMLKAIKESAEGARDDVS
jgi:hypothetical protein